MNTISEIVQKTYSLYPSCKGPTKQEGYKYLVTNLLEICPGNILEIGAFEGKSTRIFLEIAKSFNKKVYVVDPWNGQQEGTDQAYKKFLENTHDFSNLEVIKQSSQNPVTINVISNMSLAFCLIDGLHKKSAVTSDIQGVQKALFSQGVILVDDVRDLYGCLASAHEIMDAVNECQNEDWKHLISPPDWLGSCLINEGKNLCDF